jgi:Actinobacteria/chloroflexi VLRF1 release factor
VAAHGPQRRIEVSPQRLAGWVQSFAQRHGELAVEPNTGEPNTGEPNTGEVVFRAGDGSIARCAVPFPPLPPGPPGEPAAVVADRIAAHACADRTVGVLLVRLGGYAAGVFTGTAPVLAASKVGSRLVHGRSAAGGTSQRRFARRRENQAHQALAAAADTAAAVFGGYSGKLDAVVLGGDRRALARLRTDPRLTPYFALATDRVLAVPDPRLSVLSGTPRLFRAITVTITEPEPA